MIDPTKFAGAVADASKASEPLVAALAYARAGLSIFPCSPTNKQPLTLHGFRDATTQFRQIKLWWRRWPDAMIGLPTGPESGVFVLDVDLDPEKQIDGFAALAALENQHGNLPETLRSITPRDGEHFYFLWHDGIKNSTGKLGAGLDSRGDGGYTILPPSCRVDGKCYAWIEISASEPREGAQWLIDRLLAPKEKAASPQANSQTNNLEPAALPPYLARLPARGLAAAALAAIHASESAWSLQAQKRIESALKFMPAFRRDIWRDVGMILKDLRWTRSDGTNVGFEIWNAWSQTCQEKYPGVAALEYQWDSFGRTNRPDKLGLGTLYLYAKEAGWTDTDPPSEKIRKQSEDGSGARSKNGEEENRTASDGRAGASSKDGEEENRTEPPRPLMRDLPPADPFPVDALGRVLAAAARAIYDRVRAPVAICGQSVLAAATLAVQGLADVELPMGQTKPLSNFFVSIAATGERKSAVDHEALWPVHKREAMLREASVGERLEYENKETAWKKARDAAAKKAKGDHARIKAALDALGPAPLPPLEPLLACGEPTFEGLCKLLAVGWPSIGIFAAEGGQFIGGHGMTDDAKLRTAAGLSALWDGEPIKRVRALDGFTVLPGRRVAMHLMAQPDVAAIWLGDRLLVEQGLMSRVLLTAPEPASGTRIWREVSADSDASIKRYGARLLEILKRPLLLAERTHNELAPRKLPLSSESRRLWIAFHDHVERRLGMGGELEPVRGLANKLPEHAARIAAVLALVDNVAISEVGSGEMEAGIALAQHYAAEAMRLFGASRVGGELREAQQLLAWLQTSWGQPRVSLPDIYQRGPNSIRDKARAHRAVSILAEHGWLVAAPAGDVDGTFRRDVWSIVRG